MIIPLVVVLGILFVLGLVTISMVVAKLVYCAMFAVAMYAVIRRFV